MDQIEPTENNPKDRTCKAVSDLIIKSFIEDLVVIQDAFDVSHNETQASAAVGKFTCGVCIEIKHR